MKWRSLLILGLWLALGLPVASPAQDADPQGIDALPEVPLAQLTEADTTTLGRAALAVRPGDWRHSETPHYILHFFRNFVAAQAAVELEFYYNAVATELHQDTTGWERKSQVYIFDNQADWHAFQKTAQLDPWTGGLHSDGNLFIVRDPSYKFEGRSLGHETAHLVLYRFLGAAVPLWLNEGYAENSSIRFYAGLERQRGYNMKPHSAVITASNYIPVATLASMAAYPDDVIQVSIFYQESEKLVAFLRAQDPEGFITFMQALSHGSLLDTALQKGFGSRFSGVDDLDRQFADFAQKQYEPVAGN
jgi:hypothetical protein